MTLQEQRYAMALSSYRFKIRHFASLRSRDLPGFSHEDVEQELNEVLWRVVSTYDPNNGAKFNTYFWQCARNRVSDLAKRAQADKRKSEWFEFDIEQLDPDSVSMVVERLERGDWQQIDGMTPEDWYCLRETIIERLRALAA